MKSLVVQLCDICRPFMRPYHIFNRPICWGDISQRHPTRHRVQLQRKELFGDIRTILVKSNRALRSSPRLEYHIVLGDSGALPTHHLAHYARELWVEHNASNDMIRLPSVYYLSRCAFLGDPLPPVPFVRKDTSLELAGKKRSKPVT